MAVPRRFCAKNFVLSAGIPLNFGWVEITHFAECDPVAACSASQAKMFAKVRQLSLD
jgi:hypothetical protein